MIRNQTCFVGTMIMLFTVFFASCRSARYLEDNQMLVTSVSIEGLNPDLRESANMYVSNEIRPNSPLYFTIYNLFNTKKGRYKKENIKRIGESPRVLDSAMVDLSANQIERFLQTQGYFEAVVSPEISINKKKARVNFKTDLGDQFQIANVSRSFEDARVEAIHKEFVLPNTKILENSNYLAQNLYDERELLYTTMKDKGYFEYLRQYMRVGLDTLDKHGVTDVNIQVNNPTKSSHHIFEIDSVYFRILKGSNGDLSPVKSYFDSTFQIQFEDYTGKFRLRPLARYAFLRKGDLYNLTKEDLSYDRLYETSGFRSVKINYQKVDSNRLNVHYELIPRPAMSNQVEGEFVFSSGMSGFNIANTFSHRNIFGGSEIFELRLRYGTLFDPRLEGGLSDKVFNNDFQVGASLVFPRILLPFRTRALSTYGLPRTTISSTLQLFFQDNTYANRYFINTLNYTWNQRENLVHSYTPLVLEYREGRLDNAFRQRLEDEGYFLYIRSNDRQYFGLGSQYAITYNGNKLNRLADFSFFRGMLDVSGNTLGVVSSLFDMEKNNEGERLVFGVPYLQYIKGEVDYRWYRHIGGNKQFVFRFNAGLAVPYGNNSSLLIFEKSFFAGGMNGIRAWQARTLGPGSYNRSVLTSEELRLNLRNLDQLGEIKMETNAEYRFRIFNQFLGGKLNGATFVDAGNIWRLRSTETNVGGEFKANKFLSQIAVGTGFGVRYDMGYFTLRLDAGLKVKDPQFVGKDQWVIRYLFDSKEFKTTYYNSNRPDRYSFTQFNFGVGMPF